jgi:Fe-S cluster assembly protein SufD
MSQGSPSTPPAWGTAWSTLRAEAQAEAEQRGAPVNAAEDWRYVDLKPLKARLETSPRPVSVAEVDAHRLPGAASLVLLDGVFRADLSNLAAVPPGVVPTDLQALSAEEGAVLVARWRAQMGATRDPSVCWSLADCAGGVRLRVRGSADRPVHLLALSTGGRSAARVSIELERGATLELAISHVALGRAHAVVAIDVELADGSALRVDEAQYGPAAAEALRFDLLWSRLGRDARLGWTSARTGAALSRARQEITLAAPGAALELDALARLDGARQHHDVARVRHAVGDTTSRQLVKDIAAGTANASFDGLVVVEAGADRSDAEQRSSNLLLSPGARIEPRPQLDILTDDVKAAHGASVGRLDPGELFYLRTRGLSEVAARTLLIRGFAGEIAARLHLGGMRAIVEREILAL